MSNDQNSSAHSHPDSPRSPSPEPHMTGRNIFEGHIAGAGTAGGTRLVLGCWITTPHGPFADVMVERSDGHRILIAPDAWVADFVTHTYSFDETHIEDVSVSRTGYGSGSMWHVTAGPLSWSFAVGRRLPIGYLLATVPRPVARLHSFAQLTNLIAPLVMPGVHTLGSAGNHRTEWYAAHDLHAMTDSRASWEGDDLGALRDVTPPPRFGFSSTPATPSVTAVTTTVAVHGG